MSSTDKKHYRCVEPPKKIKLLIVAEAPPKPEGKNYFYCLANGNRQFFRCIMKGVGLLKKDTKWDKEENWDKENRLLEAFLDNGYFLIDTCPEPLKGENVTKGQRKEEMDKWKDSLVSQIGKLNPEKKLEIVIFINKTTNEPIRKYVAKKFPEGMIYEKVLSSPLQGHLKDFIKEFPCGYRLSPIF